MGIVKMSAECLAMHLNSIEVSAGLVSDSQKGLGKVSRTFVI